MIREKRRTDSWQKVSHIELGPGQYSPYTAKDGRSFSIGLQEKPYKLDTCFPKKKTDIPFGCGTNRFQKFNIASLQPGPCSYESKPPRTVEDTHNHAATAFKSKSPRLQMYYELERSISKSTLTYDKQELLAKQLVELIDKKMRERGPPNLFSKSALNESDFQLNKYNHVKALTGLAITNSQRNDRVPSIPFEPRKEELEKLGPGTYDPNPDVIHKKLPALAVLQKNQTSRPVPKKALESFINTVFTTNDAPQEQEKSNQPSSKLKQLKLGKALFIPMTEQGTPRNGSSLEHDFNPLNKPSSIFASKTKRTNLIDEKALGPGFYNPHEFSNFGTQNESAFRKKIDFGNQESRKFTLNRNMASPFTDSTYIENPESWKYQHPEKESAFQLKKKKGSLAFQPSQPNMNFTAVAKVGKKHNQIPGPGSYDINFKDELKILDQKLSIRYQLGPFGSTSPRFREKTVTNTETQNDQKSQQIFNIMKKQEMRKYMDEALNMIKNIQKNQQSAIFKSSTERFSEQSPDKAAPSSQVKPAAQSLVVDDRERLNLSTISGSGFIKPQPYNPTVMKPFDSTSPRFNYSKEEEKQFNSPGPGYYTKTYDEIQEHKNTEIKRSGTINKKFVPAIGTESKERFSLFGQIVKHGQDSCLGPGSYDTHVLNSVASKKVFNASLQKASPRLINNLSGLGQSSLSTNVKLSPRSNNTTMLDQR